LLKSVTRSHYLGLATAATISRKFFNTLSLCVTTISMVITERRKLALYAEFRGAHFKHKLENAWPGNTKGGSMAVQLTSCLTGLD
jgi:hypothetical protein